MSIATRTGDMGKTGLMYGRRSRNSISGSRRMVRSMSLTAALGMARAHAELALVKNELLLIQKQLVALMGELAVAPEDAKRYEQDKYPKLGPEMLQHLDDLVAKSKAKKSGLRGGPRRGRMSPPPRSMWREPFAAGPSGWWPGLPRPTNRSARDQYLNRLSDLLG